MDAWAANFIWVALALALVCWWLAKLFWLERFNFIIRVVVVLVGSFCIMTILGAIASLIVHVASSTLNVGQIFIDNPSEAFAYFTETGWETGVFWFPVLFIRVIVLSIKSWRKL